MIATIEKPKEEQIGVQLQNEKLESLVSFLEEVNKVKVDFSVPFNEMDMENGNIQIHPSFMEGLHTKGVDLSTISETVLRMNFSAETQLCNRLGIRIDYWRKCKANIAELADLNVNHWLKYHAEKKNKNLLLRTYMKGTEGSGSTDGLLRAVLSERYGIVDNIDILYAVLDAITQAAKESKIHVIAETCDLTDKRMYCRFIAPQIQQNSIDLLRGYRNPNEDHEGGVGTCVGFVIGNSETGHGS
jgi:hypothetical protein